MSSERWLPVVGFEGSYEVSDLGRVRSWLPYRGTTLPRVMALHSDTSGYPSLRLWNGARQVHVRVHRLVCEAFIGPRPSDLETRHLNGDASDCRLTNLAYGTASENGHDRTRHGTNPMAGRTHCPANHEYTADNTRYGTRGNGSRFRICKTCERDRGAVRRAARRVVAA